MTAEEEIQCPTGLFSFFVPLHPFYFYFTLKFLSYSLHSLHYGLELEALDFALSSALCHLSLPGFPELVTAV